MPGAPLKNYSWHTVTVKGNPARVIREELVQLLFFEVSTALHLARQREKHNRACMAPFTET